ncbi:hypothetical protein [Adhaeretor mobilis]|nr:hypothetical protein [Adhaeretor mobilis]
MHGSVGQGVEFGVRGALVDYSTWWKVDDANSPSRWRIETTVDTTAEDIEIPLQVDGTYAVYVGVYMPDTVVFE